MSQYVIEPKLSPRGSRREEYKEGSIRIIMFSHSSHIIGDFFYDWTVYLNIIPSKMIYNAIVERENKFRMIKTATTLEVPSIVLEEIVKLAKDKAFMSLKQDDLNFDFILYDAPNAYLSFKSDEGALIIDDSLIALTFEDGKLPTKNGVYDTPFHKLVALFNTVEGEENIDIDEDL